MRIRLQNKSTYASVDIEVSSKTIVLMAQLLISSVDEKNKDGFYNMDTPEFSFSVEKRQ